MFSFARKPRKALKAPPPPETREVDINGRRLPLTIRRDFRATRLTLRIEPGGRALRMTVPNGIAERDIRDFLDRHQGWLMTKLAKFRTTNELADGGYVMIRGVSYRIEATGRLRGFTEALVIDDEAVLRAGGRACRPHRQAREIADAARYPQPLGLLLGGWRAQLLLAHRHGAARRDRLSRRP
jgi:hypothetical protein